jgi:hypothetical protein
MSQSNRSIMISNTPLPIDGNNPNAVKVDGSGATQPISGTVAISNFPSPSASPSVNTATQAIATLVGGQPFSVILTERDARLKVVIYSEGGPAYILAGPSGASVNQYTWVMQTGESLEITNYVGPICAINPNAGSFRLSVTDF